jgi:SanA protein
MVASLRGKKLFKRALWIILPLLILTLLGVIVANRKIVKTAKGFHSFEINRVPSGRVGLLLGTSKYLKGGGINYYYEFRVRAAVALYKSGKVSCFILSGDNGNKNYDEPSAMRDDLMRRGIPGSAVVLDYAGFRTFDSMVRCKEIFGKSKVVVISQRFHNERAIYIGKQLGMEVYGFNAQDVKQSSGFKTKVREYLARVKVFYDAAFGVKPKFLGKKVVMPC